MSSKTKEPRGRSSSAHEWVVGLTILVLIIIGGIYLFTRLDQKSNAQKFSECSLDVGKIHDSARKTITTNSNGYSKAEQEYYYKQNSNAYARDLENCRTLYGQLR